MKYRRNQKGSRKVDFKKRRKEGENIIWTQNISGEVRGLRNNSNAYIFFQITLQLHPEITDKHIS